MNKIIEQAIDKYDLSCRICGLGFRFKSEPSKLIPVKCEHCGSDAQIFNDVVIQDDGTDSFSVYGEIKDCFICRREPEIEFMTVGDNARHYFVFSCGHYDTEFEDQKEVLVTNADLNEARVVWNITNRNSGEILEIDCGKID